MDYTIGDPTVARGPSKVEIVVLGLLAEEPLHGYQLLERFRSRSMGLWVEIGRASVYQALERLERRGLLAGRAQGGVAGPDRRVFRLTSAGRARLEEGLRRSFDEPGPYETAAGTALGFLEALPPSGTAVALEARGRTVRAHLEAIRAEQSRTASGTKLAEALLARQMALAEAELAWLKRYRTRLTR